ncbi:hypothetical protein EMIHUDRAFT_361509, partial [Emiliania huxleyi CCMP1516]|uniref:Uncharacterized protein n=2 Tax=Emiliania huxleyi TaxID=2903 RepID=A0A0D3KSY3_EMIH1
GTLRPSGHCVHRDIASIGPARLRVSWPSGHCVHRDSSPSGQLAIGTLRPSGQLAFGSVGHRDIASIGTLRPSGHCVHRASSPSGQLAIGPARLRVSWPSGQLAFPRPGARRVGLAVPLTVGGARSPPPLGDMLPAGPRRRPLPRRRLGERYW